MERAEIERVIPVRERKPLYTPREVAAIARVDPKTVLGWIHQGRLSAIRLSPRIYRIPLAAVMKLLFPEYVRSRTRRTVLRERPPEPGAGEPPIRRRRATLKSAS